MPRFISARFSPFLCTLSCLVFTASLLAQQTGETKRVTVPMMTESWQKTAVTPGMMQVIHTLGGPTAAELDNDQDAALVQARQEANAKKLRILNQGRSSQTEKQ